MSSNHFNVKAIDKHLSLLLTRIDIPKTNNSLDELAYHFFIGKALDHAAKRYLDPSTKAIRNAFNDKLQKPCDKTELLVTPDVTIFAKVNNPRETFDKNEFIKQVALKYNIASAELHAIASNAVKQSAAPVTLSVD